MYWPEDDQALVETCSHIIYVNKKTYSVTVSYSGMRFVKVLSYLSFAVGIKFTYKKTEISTLRRYLFTSFYAV
jgi:hypothetical protein